jgi:hypothetical protein
MPQSVGSDRQVLGQRFAPGSGHQKEHLRRIASGPTGNKKRREIGSQCRQELVYTKTRPLPNLEGRDSDRPGTGHVLVLLLPRQRNPEPGTRCHWLRVVARQSLLIEVPSGRRTA